MHTHQERIVAEKAALDEKLEKLNIFKQGQVFASLPDEERGRLITQSVYMAGYSRILGERIVAFTKSKD